MDDDRTNEMSDALQQCAAIAHEGGRIGLSKAEALVEIRRLTLPYWLNAGSQLEREDAARASPRRCGTCAHYDEYGDMEEDHRDPEAYGQCLRFPPVYIKPGADLHPNDPTTSEWMQPFVLSIDTCGEWRQMSAALAAQPQGRARCDGPDEVAAFEAWARDESFTLARDSYGDYVDRETRGAWDAWKARGPHVAQSTGGEGPTR